MSIKTPIASFSALLLLTFVALSPARAAAQERGDPDASLSPFIGNWKGVCADGKEFIVVTIVREGASVGGSVSIANMRGADGQCDTVVDPPNPEHSMKITDAHLRGAVLAFKGSHGSRNAQFEMTIDVDEARLKFLGTPVEENPWKLEKAQ